MANETVRVLEWSELDVHVSITTNLQRENGVYVLIAFVSVQVVHAQNKPARTVNAHLKA